MKRILLLLLLGFGVQAAFAQNITRIEYFIDTDPGYGSATPVGENLLPAPSLSNLNFPVAVSASLGNGLHHLFIRARDENGNWSVVSRHLFYKDQFTAAELPDIIKVEYFVDSDPGYGAATNVPVTPGADVYDLAFSVDASTLSDGIHKLFIRAQNALGHWSVVGIKDFAVQDNGVALLDFPQTWCVNNTINVPFTSVGTFNSGNEYKVQLSNNGGSFPGDITSRIIGSVASTAPSGILALTIPTGLGVSPGSYKVRMVATDPQVPGVDNVFSEEIPVTITAACPCASGTDLLVSGAVTEEILCYGQAAAKALLTGSGGMAPLKYSINGTDFQGNPAFADLAAGTYTLTVRDVNWCTATSSLEITQPAELAFGVPVITAVTCHNGSDGKVQVSVSGGTGAYTYSIDGTNFQPSAEFTGLVAGDYTVTVKDANECIRASANYTVTQPPALSSVLSGGGGPAVCEGTPVNLAVTVTNGTGPFTVVYSDGVASVTVNSYVSGSPIGVAPLITTTYSLVSVTDANGCTSPTLSGTATVNVTPKPTIANAGEDITGSETCGLTLVTLAGNTPTAGSGEWSILSGAGGSFTDATNPASGFNGTAGTTYLLKWTISNAPCAVSADEVSVTFGSSLSLAVDGDNASAIIPDNVDFNLTTDDCRLIATINGTSLTNGVTPFQAGVTIDNVVGILDGQPYVQRHFSLVPGGTSPASATVTLYVTKGEMEAFNAESTVDLPVGPGDDKTLLRVWQWHGVVTPANSPDAIIDPVDTDITWDEGLQAWKIKFGVSGFSTFVITAEDAKPLPVSLVDFTAQKLENAALLTWQTTTETNSERFEIEHTRDGRNWQKIGSLASSGESNTLRSYRYVHQGPSAGINYYRLKMVDLDDTFGYSGIISLSFHTKDPDVSLYPNPARDQLTISLSKPGEDYEIVNALGQVVGKDRLSGEPVEQIPVRNLPAGVYHIRVKLGDGSSVVRKVIVE